MIIQPIEILALSSIKVEVTVENNSKRMFSLEENADHVLKNADERGHYGEILENKLHNNGDIILVCYGNLHNISYTRLSNQEFRGLGSPMKLGREIVLHAVKE